MSYLRKFQKKLMLLVFSCFSSKFANSGKNLFFSLVVVCLVIFYVTHSVRSKSPLLWYFAVPSCLNLYYAMIKVLNIFKTLLKKSLFILLFVHYLFLLFTDGGSIKPIVKKLINYIVWIIFNTYSTYHWSKPVQYSDTVGDPVATQPN